MFRVSKMLLAFSLLLLTLAGGVAAASENHVPTDQVYKIGEDVFGFTSGGGTHSMFVIGEKNVVVFETFNPDHSKKLIRAVRSFTDKKITHAFQTHNHWDHAGGGQSFLDEGAETVMHELAAQWVAAHPRPDTVAGSTIWSGSRKDYDFGDFTVEMHYLGLNHGLGMTVFVVPEKKVAFIADLVTPNRVMFTVVPDFNIGEWERSLGEILALDFEVAVCSHTELPGEAAFKGCTKQHVSEERQYIRDLRGAIIAKFEKGTGFYEIAEKIALPQYAHWVGYDKWLEMNAYRLMLDLYMGPFPWVHNAN
ncbi:MBL fold metallo-hydrolase [Labrenzia sp. PHM005]|uniref:MBL fold metallo-hydrolase n=1 Tax=Labrenzia sp. PHM005 TaxID=2590016 RepID=UPI0011404EA5|nr:MBL fold metallo-hydrolase [Labrenzia sp. PHM005]QDG76658.1 MBL fold metallo-hydrolase [Labrenzia sp. PHM005]